MSETVLSLSGLSAGYGPLTILNGVSLALRRGEVLLILGANGSGKSTVLKTIMGLTRTTAGSIHLGQADMTRWPSHRRAEAGIGYVPQVANVFPSLTVRENLKMGAYLCADQLEARLPPLFQLFPRLKSRLRAKAGALSGGERRMLSIALTMVAAPKLLLLDEPSSDLAPALVSEVFAAIREIHDSHDIPVLLVEQNIAQGLSIADRVVVMAGGRVVAEMATDEVHDDHLHALFLEGTHRRAEEPTRT
ncbi:ABC transporter ATP-binding protein [Acuticoccus kandeliae]|uniref:ABC transporter ATP-binding protein n=1 Tax=Acuticoccus kandeliae TaxID=2073160 RepID=UPI000D3E8534|nr:ABC transporter ATP-binding protein [Acuticoccus kandeliae]